MRTERGGRSCMCAARRDTATEDPQNVRVTATRPCPKASWKPQDTHGPSRLSGRKLRPALPGSAALVSPAPRPGRVQSRRPAAPAAPPGGPRAAPPLPPRRRGGLGSAPRRRPARERSAAPWRVMLQGRPAAAARLHSGAGHRALPGRRAVAPPGGRLELRLPPALVGSFPQWSVQDGCRCSVHF